MKHKKLLIIVGGIFALLLILIAIGKRLPPPEPRPSEPTPPSEPVAETVVPTPSEPVATLEPSADPVPPTPTPSAPSAEDLANDTEAKAAIQASAEALVDEKYKGSGYACDILTRSDASGYIVSLQIDLDLESTDPSEVVGGLEKAINGLGDSRIAEVQITALKNMQIVATN